MSQRNAAHTAKEHQTKATLGLLVVTMMLCGGCETDHRPGPTSTYKPTPLPPEGQAISRYPLPSPPTYKAPPPYRLPYSPTPMPPPKPYIYTPPRVSAPTPYIYRPPLTH